MEINTKVRCKICGDIIKSNNDKDWIECSCGSVQIVGKKGFKIIKGKPEDYIDLSKITFDNLPTERGEG